MIRPICKWDSPILSKVCEPVTIKEMAAQVIQDLRDTLKSTTDGIGMAAPQIGYPYRIVLVRNNVALINPEIIRQSGKQKYREGCLSYPNKFVRTKRPTSITVKHLNENMEETETVFFGMDAIVCCHEMDHLDGRCIVKQSA